MQTYLLTTSNLLSFFRMLMAPIIAALIYHQSMAMALILFTLASSSDFFDGYLARKYNSITNFGKFIDPLADKILVIGTLIAFYAINTIPLWIVVVIATRDIIVTGLRIITPENTLAASKTAKWKTFLQFVIIYFLFALGHTPMDNIIYIILYGIVGLTVWTGIQYLTRFI